MLSIHAYRRAACWVAILPLVAVGPGVFGGPGREPSAPAASAQLWRTKLATDVLPKDAVWDSAAFGGNYELLDLAGEAASQHVTWTLRSRQRVTTFRDFSVVAYDRLGRRVAEAPLAWSKGRRESGTAHLASLDLAWLSRRLGGRAKGVALLAVERFEARNTAGRAA